MPTILYQDEDLLLIDKPAGVLSQTGDADSIPQRLKERGYDVWTVHRLDRATGGVMVYARHEKSAAALSTLVGQHAVFCKTYLAVVGGIPTEPSGTLTDLLYHDARRNKSYTVRRKRRGVREASLQYEVIGRAEHNGAACSLLRIRLHTGRTHQIRVQFASRGLPLVGDAKYGGARGCPLALWSHRLTFPHPADGHTVSGCSLPDMSAFPWNLFAMPKDG